MGTLMVLGAAGLARAADAPFEIYGTMQGDYIQDSKRVDPNWESAFRPSKIETVSGEYGSDGQALLSVKQSGVGIKGTTTLENGETIAFKFNFDMFGVGENAGQTTFRLQNAYGEWRGLLAGQTDTVFMDLSIFPDTIDYWGPPAWSSCARPRSAGRRSPARPPSPSPSSLRTMTSTREASRTRSRHCKQHPGRLDAAGSDGAFPHGRGLGPRAAGFDSAAARL